MKRGPNQVQGVGGAAVGQPGGADGQEIVLNHIGVIARREAIGRVQQVRFAPADELLAELERELLYRNCDTCLAERESGPLHLAVPQRQMEPALHLPMAVGTRVGTHGKLQPGSRL